MNLQIKKHDKCLSQRFHKSPRWMESSKAKSQALKDIAKCINEEGNMTRNYLTIEYLVLTACRCNMVFININTTKL